MTPAEVARSLRRLRGLAQSELLQRAVDPQLRELLLQAVLAEPGAQVAEIDAIEFLTDKMRLTKSNSEFWDSMNS